MLLCIPLYAQWEEIPSAGTTIDFAGTFTEDANSFATTTIFAHKNFWIGGNATQIASSEEVISQDIAVRTQFGIDFLGISSQFFIESQRDMMSDNVLSSGFYLRKVHEVNKLDLVFGVGTFVERDQVRQDLGLDATDPTVFPYWLFSLGSEYDVSKTVGLHGRVIGTPKADFEHWKGTLDLGTDIVLKENLTLKIQSSTEFDNSTGELKTETENTALLSINL